MSDITKRLRDMAEFDELRKYRSGALANEAADVIEQQQANYKSCLATAQRLSIRVGRQQAEIERFRSTLESISRSTCCDQCQEAALFARAALKGEGE